MIHIGINGFGRIGRMILRALYESNRTHEMKVVSINGSSLSTLERSAHLLRYDSTFGPLKADISIEGEFLVINGDRIKITAGKDPVQLEWKKEGVDLVFECTGKFTTKEKAMVHLNKGAKKVLISAPGTEMDATIVYGVNDMTLKPSDLIVSNASCTTNCLAPVAKALNESIGIRSGLMTTIHAYTTDQRLLDGNHEDLRRARSATQSMIPTKTGAASALGLVIPELNGKLDGFSIRVPTINVSVVDLSFEAMREVSVKEINDLMLTASKKSKNGILQYNTEPLVSIDFNHNPASAIFDATQTKVMGRLVKVLAWYDNEWGFSNRMLDVAHCMMSL